MLNLSSSIVVPSPDKGVQINNYINFTSISNLTGAGTDGYISMWNGSKSLTDGFQLSTYLPFWYNQSLALINQYGSNWYNHSSALFSQYGQFWYNQTSASGNISGAGTAGYIPQWQGSGVLNNSRIFQNGSNIGIGTTSPARKFEVKEGNNAVSAQFTTASTLNYSLVDIYNSNTGNYFRVGLFNGGVAGLADSAQTTPDLTISGSNIGIGTTTPNAKLEVSGSIFTNTGAYGSTDSSLTHIIKPSGAAYDGGSSGLTGAIKIALPVDKYSTNTMLRMTIDVYDYQDDESFTVMLGGYTYNSNQNWYNTFAQIISSKLERNFTVRFGNDSSKNVVWIGETDSSWDYLKVVVTDFVAANSGDSFDNWDDGWSISLDTDLSDDTIKRTETNNLVSPWIQNGNSLYFRGGSVGIGTTSPNYKLEINSADKALNVSNNLFVNSTNIGIGTNNPQTTLQVVQSGTPPTPTAQTIASFQRSSDAVVAIIAGNTSSSYLALGDTDNTANIGRIQYNHNTNSMTFRTNGADNLHLDSAGFLGIGTTSPSEMLHLTSSSNSDIVQQETTNSPIHQSFWTPAYNMSFGMFTDGSFRFANSATTLTNNVLMSIMSTNRVGIGTTTPTHTLNVVGNVNITGNATYDAYYGEMSGNYTTPRTITIASSGVWYNVTGLDGSSSLLNGFSNLANTSLTASQSGVYASAYDISFTGSSNNIYELALAVNGVINRKTLASDKTDSAGDLLNTGSVGFLRLNSGDNVHLMVRNLDAGSDMSYYAGSVTLHRIGN